MAASDEARRFLHKAAQDEYVLARLSDDPAAPDEQLGFHAQQAVEKLLKSALFLAGGNRPGPTTSRNSKPWWARPGDRFPSSSSRCSI